MASILQWDYNLAANVTKCISNTILKKRKVLMQPTILGKQRFKSNKVRKKRKQIQKPDINQKRAGHQEKKGSKELKS